MPILLQENNMAFKLQIFDRNKKLVYDFNSPMMRINGNKKARMGEVFVWFAEVQINGQEQHGFKGEIGGSGVVSTFRLRSVTSAQLPK